MRQYDSRLVYAKTDAGLEEVTQRSKPLSQAARRILIIIDGQRRLSDLPAFARPEELAAILNELESQRLIVLVGISEERSEEEKLADQAREQHLLAQLKRVLGGAFERELGPAAAVLEARLEDCVNLDVMRKILREGIDLVIQRRGDIAAKDIIRAARPLLGDHEQ